MEKVLANDMFDKVNIENIQRTQLNINILSKNVHSSLIHNHKLKTAEYSSTGE